MPTAQGGQIVRRRNADKSGKVDCGEQNDIGHRVGITGNKFRDLQCLVHPLHRRQRLGPVAFAELCVLGNNDARGERMGMHPDLTDRIHQREFDSANPHIDCRNRKRVTAEQ